MSKSHILVLGLTFIVAFAFTVWAAPGKIDYQGYLEDGGDPVTDTVQMVFKIYDAASSGNQKWTETHSPVVVLGGLFDVTLGSSTTIPDTVFSGDTRYLQIQVDGTTLNPRTQIVSSAYAMRVNTIDGADGGTIAGDLTAGKGNFGTDNVNGGTNAFVAGEDNGASGNYSIVGGGLNDTASGVYASVAGGYRCVASDSGATVGGGSGNTATHKYSTVGGGEYDTAMADWATVGGGYINLARGDYSTVSGGKSNVAWEYYAAVGGGLANYATNNASTVAGGSGNWALGAGATVCGGTYNTAKGDYSVAAGRLAKANHNGSIVLAANSTGGDADSIRTGGVEQMVLRADGGVYLTNTAEQVPYDATNIITTRGGAYLSGNGGTWTNSCDRDAKENFSLVDRSEILRKVAMLPITRWNYKTDGSDIAHIGPVAQDFYAAFGLGNNDKAIATVDADGVALVAIQELYRITQELQTKTARLEAVELDLANLQAQVQVLLAQRSGKTTNLQTLSSVLEAGE